MAEQRDISGMEEERHLKDQGGMGVPAAIEVALLRKKIEDDRSEIEIMQELNGALKRDMEKLLANTGQMGKAVLGLREANRALTRVLAKRDKIITRQSARITDDQKELKALRNYACGVYGHIGTTRFCADCDPAVRQYCNLLSLSIKEKEAKREAHNEK